MGQRLNVADWGGGMSCAALQVQLFVGVGNRRLNNVLPCTVM